MAYKNGKTYLPRRHAAIRKLIKDKNIEGLLWIILQDCFEDLETQTTPRYGKTMLTFVIQQLAVIENKKSYRGKKSNEVANSTVKAEDIIAKWLGSSEEVMNEEEDAEAEE